VIDLRVDDLAFFSGEAIVRPVNADLGATTPLLRRLEVAAGDALLRQLEIKEPLPVGAAVVTGAGALGASLMVHAVIASRDEPVSRDSVRRALTSAMQRVESWQIKSVGIAPFGLGAGNLQIEDSANVMLQVLGAHLARSRFPESITIVAENDEEESALAFALHRSRI
jgi:O-acetyl-ADP-ribose deacetylase (regulator of RNase III)